MTKTKFYTTAYGKMINIENIALVESVNHRTIIRLNITDLKGEYIICEDAGEWSSIASIIDQLAKEQCDNS